jgi:hypothetical protein
MQVVALSPPGRLPTVVYDPGEWWSHLAACHFRPAFLALNVAWWRTLCGATGARLTGGLRRRAWRWSTRADLGPAAEAAGRGLESLRESRTYSSPRCYLDAVTPFAEYVELLNRSQDELHFHVDFGPQVSRLDYGDSRALVAYARRETVLARTIAAALPAEDRSIDLLVVSVSRPEELLTALIAVRLLKERGAVLHACLADHGHENFTLAPHLARLRTRGTLDSIFDTIVESKDERDRLVPEIARALTSGRARRGYLRGPEEPAAPVEPRAVTSPPVVETFCCEPILWARISPRRCFWDRCTFCALNAKFADPRAPSAADIPEALDRLEAYVSAGYRIINFGDEALSPALLERLCRGILERGLDLGWACCCKLETSYSTELFTLMRAAGCYEIFWGLESTSPRTLRLMDKEVHGLDRAGVRRILDRANEAGIGLHVSLMAGFPGDTRVEAAAAVEFVIEALREASNATFNLNRFVLLEGSPIMADPARFGVMPLPTGSDMPFLRSYRLAAGLARDTAEVDRALPQLIRRLYEGLGWDRFGRGAGPETALDLHFFFGHGSIFKRAGNHPFANPLRRGAGAA